MRFILGLALGVLIGAGGMFFYLRQRPPAAPPDAAPPPATKKRKPPRSPSTSPSGTPDLRPVTVGDVLRPEQTIDMQGGESRDLSQQEIDVALAGQQKAIESCMLAGREATGVGGRVTAAMLVGPDGRVRKTRVEAPRALVDAGLATCLREAMERLRFPAAGGHSVVTVPLEVD